VHTPRSIETGRLRNATQRRPFLELGALTNASSRLRAEVVWSHGHGQARCFIASSRLLGDTTRRTRAERYHIQIHQPHIMTGMMANDMHTYRRARSGV
jgi:hypothetical protein